LRKFGKLAERQSVQGNGHALRHEHADLPGGRSGSTLYVISGAKAQSNAQNDVSLTSLRSLTAGSSADDLYEGATMASQDELVDAKLAAAEARTDTKIAKLEGKLDLVLETVRSFRSDVLESGNVTRTEARDNRRAVIANQWVIFGAFSVILGIVVAAAPVVFDLGSKWRETLTTEVREQLQRIQSSQPAPPTPTPPNRPAR
jgi:hypothetical protein